jgi:hypothetical protein
MAEMQGSALSNPFMQADQKGLFAVMALSY